jgi:hypothetical protein
VGLKAIGFGPAALTCAGKTDGGGAQVHAVLSVQAFCRRFGFTYLHTPFSQIEHTSGPEEVARWEATFRLGEGHGAAQYSGLPVVPLKTYARNPALWFQHVIVALQHAHDYTDAAGEDYDWFRLSHEKPREADEFRIALHIRRGDVSAAQNATRFTPDEKILATLDFIYATFENLETRTEIHVYSQGRAEDFAAYTQRGAILHLNGDALSDLTALSRANLLIISKSSFSYVAGLLCEGLVIYEPFWHKPMDHWLEHRQSVEIKAAIRKQNS